jgi:hypothetical protein
MLAAPSASTFSTSRGAPFASDRDTVAVFSVSLSDATPSATWVTGIGPSIAWFNPERLQYQIRPSNMFSIELFA